MRFMKFKVPVEKGFAAFKFMKIVETRRQAEGFEIVSVQYPEDISKGYITIEIKQAYNSGEIKDVYDYFNKAGMKAARRIANSSKDIFEAYIKAQPYVLEFDDDRAENAEEKEMYRESKEARRLTDLLKNMIVEKAVQCYREEKKNLESGYTRKQQWKEESKQ